MERKIEPAKLWKSPRIASGKPALVLAPMDGVTDAPMRWLLAEVGGFDFAVSEFVRVSISTIPAHVFRRRIPELDRSFGAPLPTQAQLLGGHPDRMAASAEQAVLAGAEAVDINFGCPAPCVNRNDGGASILREPCRIESIVRAVRNAVPSAIPVSAKIRLGWDCVDDVLEIAKRAQGGGADWLTIHARTKQQGYAPPVHWRMIGLAREVVSIPIVANGDIRCIEDFALCREMTGCEHFMIGRGALARPGLPIDIASVLHGQAVATEAPDWIRLLERFQEVSKRLGFGTDVRLLGRMKQWSKFVELWGDGFPGFDHAKTADSVDDFLRIVRRSTSKDRGVPRGVGDRLSSVAVA